MKKIIQYFLLITATTISFLSCKKEDPTVQFLNGSSISLSSDNSTGTITVNKGTKDKSAISFSWTNPNYKMNNGASSLDVSYDIEMRVHDSSVVKVLNTISKDLSTTITQSALSDFLTKDQGNGGLNCTPDSVVKIDVRVKAYLGASNSSNSTNVYSDWLTFTVNKPYSTDPDCWVVGDATSEGWTNSPSAAQKLAYNRTTKKFTITIQLAGGKYYKFLGVNGQWAPQWGVSSSTATQTVPSTFALSARPTESIPDPAAIMSPSNSGTYTLTVDLNSNAPTCTISQ